MADYDAIVIGAGPAGNAAAFDLARAGARVALIERQVLPRHKTCGGGMPMTVAAALMLGEIHDLAPEAFVEARTRYMRHTWKFDDPYLAAMNPDDPETGELSLWMVRRSVFDHALAARAACAGAELRDGLAVGAIEPENGGAVRVRAAGKSGEWSGTCDSVIGADGANGMTARSIGLRRDRALAIAIEVEAPHSWGEGHPDLRRDVCHLEYGAVRSGYAWVFPKDDHLNVGAGVFRPRPDRRGDPAVRDELHRAILDYLKLLGVPKQPEELVFHAHPLPIWNGRETLQDRTGRVLLAGDAAGLINPFFGDGILHALKSGRIAAASILERRTDRYSEAIADEFRANFDAALRMAKLFYQWPALCYRFGVLRPGATRTATRLLTGDLRFDQISSRVTRRLRKALNRSERQ